MRQLDHLVLPTASLAVARSRLTALGFQVAPDGVHPFGTANCCVYLGDGAFLEPLAIADADLAADAVVDQNVFVARDTSFRSRLGQEGFSAVVLRTEDAEADHATFVESGLSGGPMLEFSRPFIGGDGKQGTASFRLAFAASDCTPDSFFFTCQRLNMPLVDRAALERHANGALAIKSVVFEGLESSEVTSLLDCVTAASPSRSKRGGLAWRAGASQIEVLEGAALRRAFGADNASGSCLRARVIVFEVVDLKVARTLFEASGIDCETIDNRLCVQTTPGQGAIFAFEAVA